MQEQMLSDPANSSILTITGTGFGDKKGVIRVCDADSGFDGLGGEAFITLDSMDIINWSENQISVRIPSVLEDSVGTPGTGPFIVKNACGESVSGNLQINYNIENDILPHGTEKLRANIVMSNNAESFTWRCDTSVWNNLRARACVEKAIREWNCYTGVNWKLGADTTLDSVKQDGISVIYLDNSLSVGTVMETIINLDLSCYNFGDSIDFVDEADIMINANIHDWSYDTTGIGYSPDSTYFYDALLHELGHAHRLTILMIRYP